MDKQPSIVDFDCFSDDSVRILGHPVRVESSALVAYHLSRNDDLVRQDFGGGSWLFADTPLSWLDQYFKVNI